MEEQIINIIFILNVHQTVENIAVVVGRKLDYNRKEIHGINIKINIEVLDN